ncbi:tumor necrosis factor receptor superfamily member 4 [Chamaea fasciata]|uniref:tumor necrosis factor receptor superfamily member 4 n=1 Tax=Chamaea fasciata TaxID=190680 RepID=UPI00336A7BA5
MALAGVPRSVAALCLLLAVPVPASEALECGERQYAFRQRCCSDCAPGQRMRSRCSASADTVCSPCQDGYFSSRHHHGFCRSCTVCQAVRKGSVEAKPCESTSDRLCVCRPGFQPAAIPAGSQCSPCPAGTFSGGGNENCRPWTNCSSLGKSTLRAGTAAEDALCGDPGLDPLPTEFPGNSDPIPTEFPENRAPFPTEFPENGSRASNPGETPLDCRDPGSGAEPSWGSLSLLLLCLILLMVSGISILLLILQAAQKKSRNGSGTSIQHKGGSCRVPIQEEQLDPNSSLIKN